MRQPYEAFAVEEEDAPKAAFHAKLTGYVFFTCIMAASGGILFGKAQTQCTSDRTQPDSDNTLRSAF